MELRYYKSFDLRVNGDSRTAYKSLETQVNYPLLQDVSAAMFPARYCHLLYLVHHDHIVHSGSGRFCGYDM